MAARNFDRHSSFRRDANRRAESPASFVISHAPVDLALNYDILLHLAFLGAGMFLFARVKNISTAGAMLAPSRS